MPKSIELSEKVPFVYEFEGQFSIWEQDGNVLFLSVQKEDKELPYAINIGGLTLDKYCEILKQYNNIATT